MLHTIAVTRNATPMEQQQGKGETVVVPPDNTIVASHINTAILFFGAKHAKQILEAGGSPDYFVVQVRQGI